MWLRISSASLVAVAPKLGWLGLAIAAGLTLASSTAEPVHPLYAAPTSPASLDISDWTPPPELAADIRSSIATRWGMAADSVVIEWQEPDEPIDGHREASRLLGPGRGGAWIALLIDGDRRATLRFRAGRWVRAPLAAADLPRERTLLPTDISWEDMVAWGEPREPDTRSREGWTTRRPIAAGEPLLPPLVTPRPAVTPGSNVTVRWTTGSVTVELPGRVVGRAAAGEEVSVRLNTGLRVRGIAIDEHTVELRAAPSIPTQLQTRRVARGG